MILFCTFYYKHFQTCSKGEKSYRRRCTSPSRLGRYHLYFLWIFINGPAEGSPLLSVGCREWITRESPPSVIRVSSEEANRQPLLKWNNTRVSEAWEKGHLRLTGVHSEGWTPFCWQISFLSPSIKRML